MKKWLMATVFGIMLVLGACGGDSGDNTAPNDNEATEEDNAGNETVASGDGEEVYKESCASCHGDDLSGEVGPPLDKIGAELSVDEIKDVIENGQGSMPAGLVSGDDEDAVAEWLASHD